MASVEGVHAEVRSSIDQLERAYLDPIVTTLGAVGLCESERGAREAEGALAAAGDGLGEVTRYAAQVHDKVRDSTTKLLYTLLDTDRPEATAAMTAAQLVGARVDEVIGHVGDMEQHRTAMAGHLAALLVELTGYEDARSRALVAARAACEMRRDAVSYATAYVQAIIGP